MRAATLEELFTGALPGFNAVSGGAGAAVLSQRCGGELGRFWAVCPRADWLLFLCGWGAVPGRLLAPLAAGWARQAGGRLDDEQREVCVALERAGDGAPLDPRAVAFEQQDAGLITDLRAHLTASTLRQACAVVLRGPQLGPSYPLVCSQLAFYAARAAGGGPADGAFLERAADTVRAHLTLPRLPAAVPESWQEATDGGWARLLAAIEAPRASS